MEWAIYFVGVADGLQAVAILTTALGGCGLVGAIFVWVMKRDTDYSEEQMATTKALGKKIRPLAVAVVLAATLTALIPSSKTLAAMIIIPHLAESEQVQNIADNSLRALEKLTAEWAAETVLDGKAEEVAP